MANNQLTSFVELMNNKNLEDINLRKNLIVSIPNLSLSFDKLRKLNLGKNMISKIEFILEFKKLKTIEELYIEGNPVIFIKDVYKKFNSLPLKFKDQAQFQIYKNNINSNNNINNNGLNNSVNQFKLSNKNNNGAVNDNYNNNNIRYTNSNFISLSTQSMKGPKIQAYDENNKIELNNKCLNNNITNKSKSKQSTINDSLSNNSNKENNRKNDGNNKGEPDNLSEEERENLLNKIENEWKGEFQYLINNGYNGYSIKKFKDTKMQLCHAEIERDKQLNLFGNAIEVLGYKEFYNTVHTIKFEFINFDMISQKQNIEFIKNFQNLKSLVFKSNNMYSFYQIIKLENIRGIEYITIRKNEICYGEILKYFRNSATKYKIF